MVDFEVPSAITVVGFGNTVMVADAPSKTIFIELVALPEVAFTVAIPGVVEEVKVTLAIPSALVVTLVLSRVPEVVLNTTFALLILFPYPSFTIAVMLVLFTPPPLGIL